MRQAQLNGEDVRDRWHNCLKDLDDGKEIDPDDVKMKVSPNCINQLMSTLNRNVQYDCEYANGGTI